MLVWECWRVKFCIIITMQSSVVRFVAGENYFFLAQHQYFQIKTNIVCKRSTFSFIKFLWPHFKIIWAEAKVTWSTNILNKQLRHQPPPPQKNLLNQTGTRVWLFIILLTNMNMFVLTAGHVVCAIRTVLRLRVFWFLSSSIGVGDVTVLWEQAG